MTACTQPGCTGRIVDGYCDLCGSPAGAAAFVPAGSAASAASPAPVVDGGLTAVGRASGSSPRPNNGLIPACTQPGCTGTIVDCYCDLCGSPAGAAPFVPAGSADPAMTPVTADELRLTAVPAPTSDPTAVHEEMPTQPIPRVKVPSQRLFTREMADPGAADPAAVNAQRVDGDNVDLTADDTEKVDGKMEFAEDESDAAQDYRTRVHEAQLPDDVRQAALCEVDKLERTSDESPESGDIRTWLDTILDLPWSTSNTAWMDMQGSHEVEATLRRLIEPAAADLEQGDTVEVEPAATELEDADTAQVQPAATQLQQAETAETEPAAAAELRQADTAETEPAAAAELRQADTAQVQPAAADLVKAATAPAGTNDDGTVVMAAVGDRHPVPQLPEQQVLEREPVQTPARKRRIGYLALAATVMAALLIGALFLVASRDRGVTAQSVPTITATATATATKPTSEPTIQLEDLPNSAEPFQTVRIEGTYPSGPNRFLQVQRWEGGEWLAFPLHPKTDKSGRFTAFVEPGPPGRYRLRLLDPESGVTSETFVLVIKG
jgi:hypothetical protein